MKNETVRPITEGQRRDILATLTQSLPDGISFEDAQSILGNKGPLVRNLRHTIEKYMPSSLANKQLLTWQKLYHDHFGIELDIQTVNVPIHRKGYDRLIVVAKGITIEQAYNVCAKLFRCCKSTSKSLDEAIPTNNRTPVNSSYAVWVRDRVEADEELKNLSADNLAAKSIATTTVLERELFELVYFIETGKHLDIGNFTLNAGSRSSDGCVPRASWYDSEFRVSVRWVFPAHSDDYLRAREVVS